MILKSKMGEHLGEHQNSLSLCFLLLKSSRPTLIVKHWLQCNTVTPKHHCSVTLKH